MSNIQQYLQADEWDCGYVCCSFVHAQLADEPSEMTELVASRCLFSLELGLALSQRHLQVRFHSNCHAFNESLAATIPFYHSSASEDRIKLDDLLLQVSISPGLELAPVETLESLLQQLPLIPWSSAIQPICRSRLMKLQSAFPRCEFRVPSNPASPLIYSCCIIVLVDARYLQHQCILCATPIQRLTSSHHHDHEGFLGHFVVMCALVDMPDNSKLVLLMDPNRSCDDHGLRTHKFNLDH